LFSLFLGRCLRNMWISGFAWLVLSKVIPLLLRVFLSFGLSVIFSNQQSIVLDYYRKFKNIRFALYKLALDYIIYWVSEREVSVINENEFTPQEFELPQIYIYNWTLASNRKYWQNLTNSRLVREFNCQRSY